MADDDARAMMARADLPPLEGAAGTAELLACLAHRCADWDVWGGPRAVRYWDALTANVRAACYAGPRLALWWERLTRQMTLHPPSRAADRQLLAGLLAGGGDAAVLAALRREAESLVLRVRIAADTRREDYQAAQAARGQEEDGNDHVPY